MGYKSIFNLEPFPTNPLPELEIMIMLQHIPIFFENKSTDYANVSTKGTWSEFGINHNKFSFVILMEIPLKFILHILFQILLQILYLLH